MRRLQALGVVAGHLACLVAMVKAAAAINHDWEPSPSPYLAGFIMLLLQVGVGIYLLVVLCKKGDLPSPRRVDFTALVIAAASYPFFAGLTGGALNNLALALVLVIQIVGLAHLARLRPGGREAEPA